jgi:hypothetical protein
MLSYERNCEKDISDYCSSYYFNCRSFYLLVTSEKKNSFSTVTEAFNNINNPQLQIIEVIDTLYFEEKRIAYVIFYSSIDKPKDYLAVAKFTRNKNGWQFERINGVSYISKGNVGNSSGNEDFTIGLTTLEVAKVRLGNHEAKMILLEEKDMQAWLFHGVSNEAFKNNELTFINKEGDVLNK